MSFKPTPRRDFMKKSLTGTLTLAAGLTGLATILQSFGSVNNAFDDTPTAASEKEFRQKAMGPAELSLLLSRVAVQKATHKHVKEFAAYELEEATALTAVLKDLDTSVPAMRDTAKDIISKANAAGAGAAFDKAYIKAQVQSHEFLRDLAQNYLSKGKMAGNAENQTYHLATLALAMFKEHVNITKKILNELGG